MFLRRVTVVTIVRFLCRVSMRQREKDKREALARLVTCGNLRECGWAALPREFLRARSAPPRCGGPSAAASRTAAPSAGRRVGRIGSPPTRRHPRQVPTEVSNQTVVSNRIRNPRPARRRPRHGTRGGTVGPQRLGRVRREGFVARPASQSERRRHAGCHRPRQRSHSTSATIWRMSYWPNSNWSPSRNLKAW